MAGKIRLSKDSIEAAARLAVGMGSVVLKCTNDRARKKMLGSVARGVAKRLFDAPNPPSPGGASTAGSVVDGEEGVVYLLRAGPHFKIGKTRDFARRQRELKIQLPFKAEPVHLIATDNISRVEAYWHRKFAHRRANGEWFALSDAEVAEFKSCRRM